MKNRYVTDTMALVLRLEKRRLPEKVKNIFQAAEMNQAEIFIPAMVFAEIAYLSEKGRIELALPAVKQYLKDCPSIQESGITFEMIQATFTISDIPELHDRIIAGCAKLLGVDLLTNDPVIQDSSAVTTVW